MIGALSVRHDVINVLYGLSGTIKVLWETHVNVHDVISLIHNVRSYLLTIILSGCLILSAQVSYQGKKSKNKGLEGMNRNMASCSSDQGVSRTYEPGA